MALVQKLTQEIIAVKEDLTVPKRKLFAPNALLTGHQEGVLTLKFSPDGNYLASSGYDKNVYFWSVWEDCRNLGMVPAHKNAVLDVQWSHDGNQYFTAGADKFMSAWDFETSQRTKKFQGHEGVVNSCSVSQNDQLVATASDDSTLRIWDMRTRKVAKVLSTPMASTCVSFNQDGLQLFSGGLDNEILVWDIRQGDVQYSLQGHSDSITGISLSPDGSYLLSNSMDQSCRCWAVTPYHNGNRCLKVYTSGASHNYEKNLLRVSWSRDGKYCSSGSADRMVYIWESNSKNLVYRFPGHQGCVNEVVFHPHEDIVASCSNDKTIIIGELTDQDKIPQA